MAATRAAELLAAVLAESSDGADLPSRLISACAGRCRSAGRGLALMTDDGPAGTVAVTDGGGARTGGAAVHPRRGAVRGRLAHRTSRSCSPTWPRTGPTRWPAFAAGALAAGHPGGLRPPAAGRRHPAGRARPLPGHAPAQLTGGELTEALSFADAATSVLLHLQARTPPQGAAPRAVWPVLDDRAEVHQATGVVSVQAGVSLAEALVLLRARAFAEERPIGELARDVLDGVVDFGRGTMIGRHGRDRRARRPVGSGRRRVDAREQRLARGLRRARGHPGRGVRRGGLPADPHRALRRAGGHRRRRADARRPAGQPAGGRRTPTSPRGCWSSSSCSRQEGPCLECFATGRVIANVDLADATDRWPVFTRGRSRGRVRRLARAAAAAAAAA